MLRALASLMLGGALGSAVLLLACSSSSSGASGGCDQGGAGGGSCTPGATPAFTSCASLTTPAVSFAKDIQPIFEKSCGINGATCHGDPNTPASLGQPFLGLSGGGTNAAQVLGGIVGKPAPEDPQMQLVKPGDPESSYMMHKLDGDQCQFATQCNAQNKPTWQNCGAQMPFNAPTLCLDSQAGCVEQQTVTTQHGERDQIRRWIAQGAKND